MRRWFVCHVISCHVVSCGVMRHSLTPVYTYLQARRTGDCLLALDRQKRWSASRTMAPCKIVSAASCQKYEYPKEKRRGMLHVFAYALLDSVKRAFMYVHQHAHAHAPEHKNREICSPLPLHHMETQNPFLTWCFLVHETAVCRCKQALRRVT